MTTPKFKKTAVPQHSIIRSRDFNSMQDTLEADITYLYSKIDELASDLSSTRMALDMMRASNRALIEREQSREIHERIFSAESQQSNLCKSRETKTFRTQKGVLFEHSTPSVWSISESNRLRIDSTYGQATLPYDNVVSRFYSVDPKKRETFPIADLEYEITAVSEGTPIKVVNGDVTNAVNGQNEESWKREVWFPLHADINEVVMDLDITVPVHTNQSLSNVIQLNTFPSGTVDILNVWYELSDTDPALDLTEEAVTSWRGPELPHLESSGFRGHFKPLAIQRIKVRLRQRNFIERNGFKVFVYGLQELSLLFVDFSNDDTNVSAASPISDKAVVLKFEAPEGFDYERITHVFSDPVVGDDLVLAIYSNFTLTNKLWDSNSPLPQSGSAIVVPADTDTLYVAVGMGYDQGDDVAPILNSVSLYYSTVRK